MSFLSICGFPGTTRWKCSVESLRTEKLDLPWPGFPSEETTRAVQDLPPAHDVPEKRQTAEAVRIERTIVFFIFVISSEWDQYRVNLPGFASDVEQVVGVVQRRASDLE